MNKEIKNKESLILLFIIVLASILRFYNAFEIPFTHDEFSALFRLDFEDFGSLIKGGVLPDTHPAGVHVFLYYWVKLFGSSEFSLKLPFILMGIASVYLIWLIAKNWYNTTVALLAALLLATLEYPIMHSQIARPYISGMFLSLWMVYNWSEYLFNTKTKFNKSLVFYVIASALSAYNHHFSLLFAAIVGISGLFFIQRNRIVAYALAGLAIFLLYSPHLSIFFHQLNKGGVGGEDGWLGAPQSDFLWQYIRYIFNFSWLLLTLLLFIIIAALFFRNPDLKRKKKFFFLSLFWFLIPIIVGYFYSIKVNPVLQYSVLIFSFPFLFFILFGHLNDMSTKWKGIALLILTPVLLYTLINDREYYTLFYNSPYQSMVSYTQQFQEEGNDKDAVSIIDSNDEITDYYVERIPEGISYFTMEKSPNRKDLLSFLQSEDISALSYGSITLSDAMIPSIIYDYLPVLNKKVDFNQGNYLEFSSRGDNGIEMYRPISYNNSFDKEEEFWKVNNKSFSLMDTISNESVFEFKEGQEWGVSFEIDFDKLEVHENDLIDIRLDIKSWSADDEMLIVSEIYDEHKEYDWRASSNREFKSGLNSAAYRMYHTIKLSDLNLPSSKGKTLKIYCWNKGKTNITVDDFSIRIRIGNPVIYGLLRDI